MIQLPPLIQYLLETSICLLVLYIVYRILFQKNTFFQLNRIYLLAGAMFSFLIPLLQFTWQQEEIEALIPVVYGSEFMIYEFNEGLQQAAPLFSITLGQILLTIYTLGVLFFGFKFIRRLYKLYLITQYSPKEEKDGILTLHTEATDTASFFNWLFFNPRHEHDDSHLIVEHELVHIRQWHSADVMIMEVLVIMNWFNPVIHLYNRSLRETHEFIADEIVSSIAHSKYDYAKLLVKEVGKSINPALTNTFASLIKKRLIMLSTKNSRKRKGLYYLAVLPALLLLVTLFSFNVADSITGLEELSSRIEEVVETPIVLEEKEALIEAEIPPIESNDLGEVFFEKRNNQYYLNVENIAAYPNNEIKIFDRFGKERIKLEDYKNNWSASILEEATYFYVFKSGDTKYQGYVYLTKAKKRMAKIQLGGGFELEQEMKEGEEQAYFSIEMRLDLFKKLALEEELPITPLMYIDGRVKELGGTQITIVPAHADALRATLDSTPIKERLAKSLQAVNYGTTLYFNHEENGKENTFLIIKVIGEKQASLQLGSRLKLKEEMTKEGEYHFSLKMTLAEFKKLALEEDLPIMPSLTIDGEIIELNNTEITIVPARADAIRAKLYSTGVQERLSQHIKDVSYGTNVYFDFVKDEQKYGYLVIEILEDTGSGFPTKSIEKSIENLFPEDSEKMPYYGDCGSIKNDKKRYECSNKAIITFLGNNVQYPAEARKKGIEGTAVIRFTVKKNGSLSFDENMAKTILRNPGGGCGEEALRVVKLMNNWTAGEKNGKKADVEFTLPIKFRLSGEAKNPPPAPPAPPAMPAPNSNTVFKIVEYMPHFPGCEDSADKNARKKCSDNKIIEFINENITYPEEARKKGEEGIAVVRFVVEKDGSLVFDDNINRVILRNPGTGLGEEAFRVIKKMPNWIPGKQDGKPVRVQFTMPIKFQLADDDETPVEPKPATE